MTHTKMVSAHKRRALFLFSRAFCFGATGHPGPTKNEKEVSLVFSVCTCLILSISLFCCVLIDGTITTACPGPCAPNHNLRVLYVEWWRRPDCCTKSPPSQWNGRRRGGAGGKPSRGCSGNPAAVVHHRGGLPRASTSNLSLRQDVRHLPRTVAFVLFFLLSVSERGRGGRVPTSPPQ
jgi:hypothetical protein